MAPAHGDRPLGCAFVEGINEIEIRSATGAAVTSLTTVRARSADASAVPIEAEDARLVGGASASTLNDGTGSNASNGAYAGWIGNGGAVEIDRAAGFDWPGDYDITVHYANAETSGAHAYNPQVVDRRLEVSEGDAPVGDAYFRYTYSWNSFWQRTVPVTLTTGDASLRLAIPTRGHPTSTASSSRPACSANPPPKRSCASRIRR